jgi:hypothetical protein
MDQGSRTVDHRSDKSAIKYEKGKDNLRWRRQRVMSSHKGHRNVPSVVSCASLCFFLVAGISHSPSPSGLIS